MTEHPKKSFTNEVLHGLFASALGKVIFYILCAAIPVVGVLIGGTTVAVSGWAILLYVVFTLSIFGCLLYSHYRRSFSLEKRLNSEAFGRAVREARRIQILNTFIPNLADLADDLVIALGKDADIEILVLHPKCEEVKYRAETLRRDLSWVEDQIYETLNTLHRAVLLQAINRHRLKVRIYKSWPPFAMYATDKEMMVGYYWAGELAIRKPQLILPRKHECFPTFQEQFREIWRRNDSSDLDLSDWQRNLDLIQ